MNTDIKPGDRILIRQQLFLGRWTVPGEEGTVIEPKTKTQYGVWIRLDKDGMEAFYSFHEIDKKGGSG